MLAATISEAIPSFPLADASLRADFIYVAPTRYRKTFYTLVPRQLLIRNLDCRARISRKKNCLNRLRGKPAMTAYISLQ